MFSSWPVICYFLCDSLFLTEYEHALSVMCTQTQNNTMYRETETRTGAYKQTHHRDLSPMNISHTNRQNKLQHSLQVSQVKYCHDKNNIQFSAISIPMPTLMKEYHNIKQFWKRLMLLFTKDWSKVTVKTFMFIY